MPKNAQTTTQLYWSILEPRSPALQADSLPFEPPGKPENTGVGSLSFLQGIFLTQELNRGLLHCRRFLYQLSYEGSPKKMKVVHFLFATVSHSAIYVACCNCILNTKWGIGSMLCYWYYSIRNAIGSMA